MVNLATGSISPVHYDPYTILKFLKNSIQYFLSPSSNHSMVA